MNERQQAQINFEKSEMNIEVGIAAQCPIDPVLLSKTDIHSDYVVQTFESGLTAEVYRIRFEGKDYTLKKKRAVSGVSNVDGQTSFLNEVQRRNDFHNLKKEPANAKALSCIVDTVYANYRLGVILSPWIEGEKVAAVTADLVHQLLNTLVTCEKFGLMEWDLCSGNMLIDEKGKLTLFDFGYMYPMNPLTDFNSNGVSDPIFHAVERFETRFYFGFLLQSNLTLDAQLENYRMLKHASFEAFREKLGWLKEQKASQQVLEHFAGIITKWCQVLESDKELKKLFHAESFRSHVLDIEDDLHGQSCTPITCMRIDEVINCLERDFDALVEQGALFYQNEGRSQADLIASYREKRVLAEKFQLI